MDWLLNLYWDWGTSILIFIGTSTGYVCGWYNHKKKCEKERHAEALRLAITDTITHGSGFMKGGKHVHLEDMWEES